MEKASPKAHLLRFATFEVDLQAGELRKGGLRLKLSGQPFQVLAILLERPGVVVTREELQKRLWPDTFVDVDHNLNTAINKIREALGDSSENPRFVETLPRRGYRFIGQIQNNGSCPSRSELLENAASKPALRFARRPRLLVLAGAFLLLLPVFWFYSSRRPAPGLSRQRPLMRLTFDDGLQIGATWSPDGRYLAYGSDRGGNFDIWVQQVSGGDPVQITKGRGHHWQPDWSPDGKYIAYRSEDGEGGLYTVPALGGAGLERKVASFGYHPRWSPDSSQILFQTHFSGIDQTDRFYVVGLNGQPPHEVLAEFIAEHELRPGLAAWHPDGKRISLSVWDPRPSPRIVTIPLEGGTPIEIEVPPHIEKEFAEVAKAGILTAMSLSWSPSGDAVFFESGYQGAINIWKITVDPRTSRALALDRLTTGPGPDSALAISADGRRLAFTAKSEHFRNWLFPFDAVSGRITGRGQPISPPGRRAFVPTLSRDGKELAFCVGSAGKWDLWERNLDDGREAPIIIDQYDRRYPQWSPDGAQLVYTRSTLSGAETQLMIWSRENRNEKPLTAPGKTDLLVFDWSSDGKSILLSRADAGHLEEIWEMPVAKAPLAESAARQIAADPAYSLYQPHYSPNGRWILFEAVSNTPTSAESKLYVIPRGGGSWRRVAEGLRWDDKPRWSPDGRAIYFVSGNGFSFDVWGIHFDPEKGEPVGKMFRVSDFEKSSLTIPRWIPPVALSITQDKMLITMAETSGGIWILDNVDR